MKTVESICFGEHPLTLDPQCYTLLESLGYEVDMDVDVEVEER